MSDEVPILIQYYNETKQFFIRKNDNLTIENFINKIKEEFSSFEIDNNITINYFKRNQNDYTTINNNEELKEFIEKAPKKHLTLLNKLIEEKILKENIDEINKVNEIEKKTETKLEEVKIKMEDDGVELISNLEHYSEILPELFFKEIDNNISEMFKSLFKCDINEDQTESFEQIQDKKKCNICQAYIINEYYFKSNTNKIICKYCESRYRNNNYYDKNGIYFLVRQNNEKQLYNVENKNMNNILDKMEYDKDIKEEAYNKKLDDIKVNEIDHNIIINNNYNELIEKNEIYFEAKIPYENNGKESLKFIKFGCVGNKKNYTNWKNLGGITYKCDFNNDELKKGEKQEVTFKKRIKKEDFIPGVMFYPLFLKNNKDCSIQGSLRILEIHNILYGDEYI